MPPRVLNQSEKYKPAITFIVPLHLRFSISTNLDIEQLKRFNFQLRAANKNMDMSHLLRKFFFKRIGVKDQNAFERLYYKELKDLQNMMYDRIGVKPLTKSFSQIMMEEITKYGEEKSEEKSKHNSI